jgi:hypothetical protein
MKKRLKFQKFTKQLIHTNLYWFYAIDYPNDSAIMVRNAVFGWGQVLEAEIGMSCIENAEFIGNITITKLEFMSEYKKALKLLRNVNIVTR